MSLKNNFNRILLSLTALGVGAVSGQEYPTRPVRIVASEVGGGLDFAARLIAHGLSANLGQQVIVDNRAGGVIPGEIVSRATPDGYTLLVASNTLWIGALLENVPYETVRDFSPISLTAKSPNILVAHPSLTVRSVKELIALAKAQPGVLNYGSAATGSSPHLAAELFKAMAGVNIARIQYKGTGPAVNAVISGEVPLMFAPAGSIVPHVKSGKLRALAVTGAEPSSLLPELPTVAITLPGYEAVQILGIWAPAKTPTTIINQLNREIVRAIHRKDIREKFLGSGVDVVGNSPQQFAVEIKSDLAKMTKILKNVVIGDK